MLNKYKEYKEKNASSLEALTKQNETDEQPYRLKVKQYDQLTGAALDDLSVEYNIAGLTQRKTELERQKGIIQAELDGVLDLLADTNKIVLIDEAVKA